MKEQLLKEVENHFRPEFINRLDDLIVFKSLNKEDIGNILDIELQEFRNRLKTKGVDMELPQEAKDLIIEEGYNPDFGARPLKRAMERLLEDPMSEELLRGNFGGVGLVKVRRDGKRLYFVTDKDE